MVQLGRCGSGAVEFARDAGIPDEDIIKWDLEETKKGMSLTIMLSIKALLTSSRWPIQGNRRGRRHLHQLHLPLCSHPPLCQRRDSRLIQAHSLRRLRRQRRYVSSHLQQPYINYGILTMV